MTKYCVDIFQYKNEQNFGDIEGVEIIQDDLLIAARDDAEHDEILVKVLTRARNIGVKFNKNKIQLRKPCVKYMGDMFTSEGLKVDPDKVQAISDFPNPKNKSELQRLLGMITFVGNFIPNLSVLTDPLRQLLKKNIEWIWDAQHDKALQKIKDVLTKETVLRYFDPSVQSVLQVDASKAGLGVCLLQSDKPVVYRSRTLTMAEKNYSNIERELLAVVWACEALDRYIYGVHVIIHSDHKPLEEIVKKPLYRTSPRLQRLLIRLHRYSVTVKYIPGKHLHIADALSRAFDEKNVEK